MCVYIYIYIDIYIYMKVNMLPLINVCVLSSLSQNKQLQK